MALPVSGPLSINMIRNELSTSNGSLRALSSAAGFSTPDAISEFYGYSPPVSCYNDLLGFNRLNYTTACSNFNFGILTGVGVVGSTLANATSLKRADCSNTILASVGFYSNGVIVRYWNGSAFTTQFDCNV
jgi:hypothetical protein